MNISEPTNTNFSAKFRPSKLANPHPNNLPTPNFHQTSLPFHRSSAYLGLGSNRRLIGWSRARERVGARSGKCGARGPGLGSQEREGVGRGWRTGINISYDGAFKEGCVVSMDGFWGYGAARASNWLPMGKRAVSLRKDFVFYTLSYSASSFLIF